METGQMDQKNNEQDGVGSEEITFPLIRLPHALFSEMELRSQLGRVSKYK